MLNNKTVKPESPPLGSQGDLLPGWGPSTSLQTQRLPALSAPPLSPALVDTTTRDLAGGAGTEVVTWPAVPPADRGQGLG